MKKKISDYFYTFKKENCKLKPDCTEFIHDLSVSIRKDCFFISFDYTDLVSNKVNLYTFKIDSIEELIKTISKILEKQLRKRELSLLINKLQNTIKEDYKKSNMATSIYKLFSPPMVEAIIKGTKTMTRRALKMPKDYSIGDTIILNNPIGIKYISKGVTKELNFKYKKGDTIFVREEHYLYGIWINDGITKTGKQKLAFSPITNEVKYKECPPKRFRNSVDKKDQYSPRWYKRNSLFMPKWAVRLELEVTNVRAEFLNEISEQDAIREGIESWTEERLISKPTHYRVYCDYDNPFDPALYSSSAIDSFSSLWQSINGKDSFDNKPVQVFEFVIKNHEKNS